MHFLRQSETKLVPLTARVLYIAARQVVRVL